ncbi:DUF2513 domain-containing protein [Stakelama tenebrarum]|uniref:DUF2513 domain-containing protein n=1 Tax=Stakelama tenebrarum TaxID=2711215 RepID=A0A6G6Y626_9SPHN|nr:DUF2513 domain-containing protein [Sphingosinithalassobacter tenebrarum]QIG80404.1 DUF2513 domain-containing protein [Sphingosinithalassobacter tenebrarum]
MKRDMDLVRAILLAVEAKPSPEGLRIEELDVPHYPDSSERRKHLVMMAEAGFFVHEPSKSSTNPDRVITTQIFDLSWAGHEYLDAIRDPEIWKRTKEGTRKIGNSSFEFVIELAKAYAKNTLRDLGLPGF